MKKLFALVLALTMTALAALSASAASWEQMQSGEWMVRLDDGSYAKNMWIGISCLRKIIRSPNISSSDSTNVGTGRL